LGVIGENLVLENEQKGEFSSAFFRQMLYQLSYNFNQESISFPPPIISSPLPPFLPSDQTQGLTHAKQALPH
jgi:hypothetical protein